MLINRVHLLHLIKLMNPADKIRVHLILTHLVWLAGEAEHVAMTTRGVLTAASRDFAHWPIRARMV